MNNNDIYFLTIIINIVEVRDRSTDSSHSTVGLSHHFLRGLLGQTFCPLDTEIIRDFDQDSQDLIVAKLVVRVGNPPVSRGEERYRGERLTFGNCSIQVLDRYEGIQDGQALQATEVTLRLACEEGADFRL